MIDKRPHLIARCTDVADVMTAVNFGRGNNLPIAIRGGGHNGPGLGSVDDGLVIDLSVMKGVRVDPGRTERCGSAPGARPATSTRNARVRLGSAVRDRLDHRHGGANALRGPRISQRASMDSTVDYLHRGRRGARRRSLVTASATSKPDLFWALRGGGGNFGVVTSFLFQAHPANMVYGGPISGN